jgi:hypothetical protein
MSPHRPSRHSAALQILLGSTAAQRLWQLEPGINVALAGVSDQRAVRSAGASRLPFNESLALSVNTIGVHYLKIPVKVAS